MPGQEIVKAAKKDKAHMIVMGTHGHGILGRALLGSVAQNVLTQSRRPGAAGQVRQAPPGSQRSPRRCARRRAARHFLKARWCARCRERPARLLPPRYCANGIDRDIAAPQPACAPWRSASPSDRLTRRASGTAAANRKAASGASASHASERV